MSDTDLFGKRPKPVVDGLLRHYHDLFVARHDVKPKISGGKDGALLKQLVSTWGEDEVRRLLTLYVQGNDPWAQRTGWTIAGFAQVAQRLKLVGDVPVMSERTRRNIEAARIASTKPKKQG